VAQFFLTHIVYKISRRIVSQDIGKKVNL